MLRRGRQLFITCGCRLARGIGSRGCTAQGEVLDSRNEGDEMFVVVRLSPENWQRWQSL